MRVKLGKSEIETALAMYISGQGINMTNKQTTFTFKHTRKGENTLTVDVDITDEDETVVESKPVLSMNSQISNVSSIGDTTTEKPSVFA